MEKTIVIYKSKYGATEQYARWIAEELDCDIIKAEDADKKTFRQYDNIIFGGGVQAGGIKGFDKIKKDVMAALDDERKKVVVFAVGINLEDPQARKQLRDINFSKRNLNRVTCYYLKGAYDPLKVKGIDKAIINMAAKVIKSKNEREVTDSERELLNVVENGGNFVDKKYIEPIIAEFKDTKGI